MSASITEFMSSRYDLRRLCRCVACVLGVLLFATGVPTATQSLAQADKIEKPDITFGVFPITNYGVVYLSLQEGFFQAEGLRVTPRVMGANPVAGIVGGDFDTGGVTWTAFLVATNRGIPLVPLSETDRGRAGQTHWMVKPDSPIKQVEDLIGNKLAVVTVGGACDMILNDLLRSKGLDYKSIGNNRTDGIGNTCRVDATSRYGRRHVGDVHDGVAD